MAMVVLDIEPLVERSEKLSLTFAEKTMKSRHSDMFPINGSAHYTRNKTKLYENRTNTKRCFNSPLNYLTRLLNSK